MVFTSYQPNRDESVIYSCFRTISEEPVDEIEPVALINVDEYRSCRALACSIKCSLVPWCSLVIWDGSHCKIYNVYSLEGVSKSLSQNHVVKTKCS